MQRSLSRRAVLGGLMASVAAIGLAPMLRAQTPLKLRIGLITPPPHQWSVQAAEMARVLAERSGGRIELAVFPAGQLGNEAQMLQLLQSGALDLAFLTAGELANRQPDIGALTAPYLVDTAEQAAKLLEGPSATALLGGLNRLGLKGLGYGMAGMRMVAISKPLGADGTLTGRKIRTVPLAQEMDFWSRAGTAPTPLPLTELFDAYTNGQIDGMQIDFEGSFNTRYHDHSAAILDSAHMIFPMIAVASGKRWVQISPEDQALIETAVAETCAHIRAIYPGIDAEYRAKLEADGATVQKVGPEVFGDAVASWNGEWESRTPVLVDLRAEAEAIKAQ